MKTLFSAILILLIFCLAFNFKKTPIPASTWGGTGYNQTVSRDALVDAVNTGVFIPKISFAGGLKQITKAEAASLVYLNESKASFVAKATNQLVVKSDLEPPAGVDLYLGITSYGYWYAYLTGPVSGNITISSGVGRGYYDECLGAPDFIITMNASYPPIDPPINGFTLTSGNTYAEFRADESITFSESIYYLIMDGVNINGVTRYNNNTFTIGATNVTLKIPVSCTLLNIGKP